MIPIAVLLLCIAISIFLILFCIFIRFSCTVTTIQQQSMYPTLVPGDRILALRHWPAHWLRKGRIVILKMEHLAPSLTGSNGPPSPLYVKRIVGVAGETFLTTQESEERVAQGSHVAVNPEQHLWHIPASSLLVRGDNRANSVDSHMWGPVPITCVQAIMLMRLQRTAAIHSQATSLQSVYQPLTIGEDAPAFRAPTLTGEMVDSQTYSKNYLLLVFFCPSRIIHEKFFKDQMHIPEMVEDETRIFLVSGSSAEQTRMFLESVHVDLPVLIAPLSINTMFQDYKVTIFPCYYYIDMHGKIISAGFYNTLNI